MWSYPVELEPAEEGGFVVRFPDVPGAITEGEDREEALERARDALETMLSIHVDEGRELPRASRPKGRPVVTPGALECAKLELYQAMREQQVRKTELARRLGLHLQQVIRLLDLSHASKIEQVEAALACLGKRLIVSARAAA